MQDIFNQIFQNINLNIITTLFQDYNYDSSTLKCQCKQQIQFLCIDNCGHQSLVCNNRKCQLFVHNHHKMCKIIFFDGLKEKIKSYFGKSQRFLLQIFKAEDKMIHQIRQSRKKLVDSIIMDGLTQREKKAIQQIFKKQNTKFKFGFHLDDFYKRGLQQKNHRLEKQVIKQFEIKLLFVKHQFYEMRQKMINKYNFIKQEKFQSTILKHKDLKYHQNLNFILENLNYPKEMKLLYRASQNQFSATKFHQLCDKIPKLLLLVKTEFGKIIGGFSSLGWNSQLHGHRQIDTSQKSFLFSVSLKQRMNLVKRSISIQSNRQFGPVFGYKDLWLSHRCNSKNQSFSNFPATYNLIQKPYVQKQQTNIAFTGSKINYFTVSEYEIFLVVE